MIIGKIIQKRKKLSLCNSCCFNEKEEKWVEKCETWCKKYNSCSLKINCYSFIHNGGQK